jgi:hypothetical protein
MSGKLTTRTRYDIEMASHCFRASGLIQSQRIRIEVKYDTAMVARLRIDRIFH